MKAFTNMGLNNYELSDPVTMAGFNADNQKVDTHAHTGHGDGVQIAYSSLSGTPDFGKLQSSMSTHAHTGGDGTTKISYANLTNVPTLVQGPWTIYGSLSELGLSQNVTLTQMITALHDKSILYFITSGGNVDPSVSPYPNYSGNSIAANGLYTITYYNTNRCTFEFTSLGGEFRFYAAYNSAVSPSFSGWKQYANNDMTQTWHDPVYQSGWAAASPGTDTRLMYTTDGLGDVHVSGNFKKSSNVTAADLICTLPVGFRPNRTISCAVTSHSTLGFATVAEISNNGNIVINAAFPGGAGANVALALDVKFKAGN